MEYNHKFSQVSSYSHKFGFDRTVLEYPQHNTPLVCLPSSEELVKETDISKDDMKKPRKKKTKK